jgi:hypothetical protein
MATVKKFRMLTITSGFRQETQRLRIAANGEIPNFETQFGGI